MGLNASQQWWIRTDGDNTNGGGFDAAISGAGVNYSDQAAAQVTIDLVTNTATVHTTTTQLQFALYTPSADDIGNIVRIDGGTATAGYYAITAVDVGNKRWTVDRSLGTAAQTIQGKMGGAFSGFEPLMATAQNGLTAAAITAPLAAGHTINLRGSGSDDPSSVDYDYRGSGAAYQGYFGNTLASGSTASGRIRVIGYNGRPLIRTSGLLWYTVSFWSLENLKFIREATGTGFPTYGIIGGLEGDASIHYANIAKNVIVDLNGVDGIGLIVNQAMDCEIRNTGGGAAGTGCGLALSPFGSLAIGCYVDGVRGDGYRLHEGGANGPLGKAVLCIAKNCGRDGFRSSINADTYTYSFINCTADGNGSDGIELVNAAAVANTSVINCCLTNNGGYGINCAVGSTALNDRAKSLIDFNNFYNNTSGARNNLSAGDNDTALDPQYTNAAGEDFSIGTNLKALGFPGAFRGSSTTGYVDIGAAQREEAGGSSGGHVIGG